MHLFVAIVWLHIHVYVYSITQRLLKSKKRTVIIVKTIYTGVNIIHKTNRGLLEIIRKANKYVMFVNRIVMSIKCRPVTATADWVRIKVFFLNKRLYMTWITFIWFYFYNELFFFKKKPRFWGFYLNLRKSNKLYFSAQIFRFWSIIHIIVYTMCGTERSAIVSQNDFSKIMLLSFTQFVSDSLHIDNKIVNFYWIIVWFLWFNCDLLWSILFHFVH